MAPVRTSAPEAAARAGGSMPRPPCRVVNTAGRAGVPGPPAPPDPGGAGGSSDAAAPASEACVRDA